MDTDPTTAAPVRLPGVSQQRTPSTPAGPDALPGLQPALAAEVPEQLTGGALHRDQVGNAVTVEVAHAGEVTQPLPAGADPGAGAERAARRTRVQPKVTGVGLPGQQVDPAVPVEVADAGQLAKGVPAAAEALARRQRRALPRVQVQAAAARLDGQQVRFAVSGEVADRGDLPDAVPAAAADLHSGREPGAGAAVQPQTSGGLLPSDDVLAAVAVEVTEPGDRVEPTRAG